MKSTTTARRRGAGAHAPTDALSHRGTVLVVEDDEDVRFVSAEALRDRGFAVEECGSLASARAALARGLPGVLLLDRELPDGSGLELARWLRCRESFDAMRIIAFSGRTAPHEIEEAFSAGCDAFVAKPCTSAALGLQVERLLARRAAANGSEEGRPEAEPPAQSEVRHVGSAAKRPSESTSTR